MISRTHFWEDKGASSIPAVLPSNPRKSSITPTDRCPLTKNISAASKVVTCMLVRHAVWALSESSQRLLVSHCDVFTIFAAFTVPGRQPWAPVRQALPGCCLHLPLVVEEFLHAEKRELTHPFAHHKEHVFCNHYIMEYWTDRSFQDSFITFGILFTTSNGGWATDSHSLRNTQNILNCSTDISVNMSSVFTEPTRCNAYLRSLQDAMAKTAS